MPFHLKGTMVGNVSKFEFCKKDVRLRNDNVPDKRVPVE